MNRTPFNSSLLATQTLINARIPLKPGLFQIQVTAGKITNIVSMPDPEHSASKMTPEPTVLDLAGDWVSLGGVDLQINGALGLAFPDLTPQTDVSPSPLYEHRQLTDICRYLWAQGVDSFLPTLVTTSVDKIQQALAAITTYLKSPAAQAPEQAQILGVHLEGPFLNAVKRGAHPAEFLQPLTLATVAQVLGDYAPLVKIITLAPELDPTGTVIPYLRSQSIIVSLGHSLATETEARQAFDQGASMVTHAFNAMPPLHHREPGLLAAAILDPRVHCGLIADGQHVAPSMLDLVLRASGAEQGIFLVSDALAPLGLADGLYPWDSRQIQVTSGTARLLDGTLSGTTLPLLVGAQNLVEWQICSPEVAIALATESPRAAMGLPGLSVGTSASLLRWHVDQTNLKLNWSRLETFFNLSN